MNSNEEIILFSLCDRIMAVCNRLNKRLDEYDELPSSYTTPAISYHEQPSWPVATAVTQPRPPPDPPNGQLWNYVQPGPDQHVPTYGFVSAYDPELYRHQYNPYPAPQPLPYVPPLQTMADPTAPNSTPPFKHPQDSRVSGASRRVVQEEEKLILQKTPLQKMMVVIMAERGLKIKSNDVELCLSLCAEERMRGILSNAIRLSKQQVDVEKSRQKTVITSDVVRAATGVGDITSRSQIIGITESRFYDIATITNMLVGFKENHKLQKEGIGDGLHDPYVYYHYIFDPGGDTWTKLRFSTHFVVLWFSP